MRNGLFDIEAAREKLWEEEEEEEGKCESDEHWLMVNQLGEVC